MKGSRKLRGSSRSEQIQPTSPAIAHVDPPGGASPHTVLWHLLVLAAATLALYAPALRNGFVTDDTLEVLQNPFITSYRYIPRLFATNVWAFAHSGTSNYYRPLQMLVYMAEYYFFGFQPLPFHIFNLVVSAACVIAVYFLVRALAGNASLALCAALLFAFHPVHVEPVDWISALCDPLCGLSMFTAMLLYHRARTGARPILNHALATAVYFAGLFCKEIAMVFPALLLAYQFLYRREPLRATFSFAGLRRLAPYAGALGIYLIFRLRALGAFAPSSEGSHRLTLRQNFLSVPVLVAQYALKLLWPSQLNYYYHFIPQSAANGKFFAAVALVGALLVAIFWLRNSQPLLSFSLAWFFITLAPVLDIAHVSDMVFAERYLFIPSFGFCVVAAWAVKRWAGGVGRKPVPRVAYAFLALLLSLYALQIERRIPQWHDDVTLFESAALLSPRLPIVQLALGSSYCRAGKFELAVEPLERSIELGPADYQPHLYLALAFANLGRRAEAVDEIRQAHQDVGSDRFAWSAFGLAHAALGQWDLAAESYRKAAQADPHNQLMFELLGEALQENGDMPGAMAAWRQALVLQPAYLDASLNLAVALAQAGNTEEAVNLLTAALQAHPREEHSGDAYANLGTVYMHRGEWDAAEAAYRHALDLNPDLTSARRNIDAIEARRRPQP